MVTSDFEQTLEKNRSDSSGTEKQYRNGKPFQVGTGTEKPYRLSTKLVLKLKNRSETVPTVPVLFFRYWYDRPWFQDCVSTILGKE